MRKGRDISQSHPLETFQKTKKKKKKADVGMCTPTSPVVTYSIKKTHMWLQRRTRRTNLSPKFDFCEDMQRTLSFIIVVATS